MKPYLSQSVLYRVRPGQVRAGQSELAAIVTKVYPDGSADLRVFVSDVADPLVLPRVPPMTQDQQSNCWRLPDVGDDVAGLVARVCELEHMIDSMTAPKGAKSKNAAA
jgi:hypothetical protein